MFNLRKYYSQNNFEYIAITLFNTITIYFRNVDGNDEFKIKIKNALLKNILY